MLGSWRQDSHERAGTHTDCLPRPLRETVEIAIEDTGPGIDESVRDEIFNPFFTTKANGTGLGLSIVRWIIEAHEGAITLDPSTKRGARFLISLPIN